jgi:hypothetical protein
MYGLPSLVMVFAFELHTLSSSTIVFPLYLSLLRLSFREKKGLESGTTLLEALQCHEKLNGNDAVVTLIMIILIPQ